MIRRIEITPSFEQAAARFEGADAKHVAAFVTKLTEDPEREGVHFERVHEARERHILSARVSRDLRAVAYECEGVLSLLWVDHHDRAYSWARTRCVECHPVTGHVIRVYEADRASE
jgi:hypothetical protein